MVQCVYAHVLCVRLSNFKTQDLQESLAATSSSQTLLGFFSYLAWLSLSGNLVIILSVCLDIKQGGTNRRCCTHVTNEPRPQTKNKVSVIYFTLFFSHLRRYLCVSSVWNQPIFGHQIHVVGASHMTAPTGRFTYGSRSRGSKCESQNNWQPGWHKSYLLHPETSYLVCTDLLMNPDCRAKTLLVKILQKPVGMGSHFQASGASQPMGCLYIFRAKRLVARTRFLHESYYWVWRSSQKWPIMCRMVVKPTITKGRKQKSMRRGGNWRRGTFCLLTLPPLTTAYDQKTRQNWDKHNYDGSVEYLLCILISWLHSAPSAKSDFFLLFSRRLRLLVVRWFLHTGEMSYVIVLISLLCLSSSVVWLCCICICWSRAFRLAVSVRFLNCCTRSRVQTYLLISLLICIVGRLTRGI